MECTGCDSCRTAWLRPATIGCVCRAREDMARWMVHPRLMNGDRPVLRLSKWRHTLDSHDGWGGARVFVGLYLSS